MYPYSYPPEPEERPTAPNRGNGGLIVLVILVALVSAAAGTFFTYRYLSTHEADPVTHAPVTLQTAETPALAPAASSSGVHDDTIIQQVARINRNSVVEITTESKVTHPFLGSYVTGGAGSGVVLTQDGYIVTNDHVISGSDSICVRLPDGQLYEATLVGTDAQTDLAVVKIAATGLTPAVFADSDAAVVGELAIAIGNPLGTLGGTVTEGIISATNREIIIQGEPMVLLQTSAAISPGNSGGGLFDKNGQLVGVVNAKSRDENVEGIGFAIPANTVKDIAATLIEHGYVTGRPMLGVEATTISSFDALYRYRVSRPGVYITAAQVGSALERGDRLLSIEGEDIASVSEAKELIGQHGVGDTVQVDIVRNGRALTIDVPLAERDADASSTMI